MNAYMNQYQQNHIATASPEQILIMLYDGALRFLGQAAGGIENGDRELRTRYINKAIAIISELSATLNHEIGGEISAHLADLYDYMIRELMSANAHNDLLPLRGVEKMLGELRETWMQAIEMNRQEVTGASASVPGEPGKKHLATAY